MTRYSLTHETLAGVPCLCVAPDGPTGGGPADGLPLVVVVHGLGSRKERMLPGLYEMARRGLRAVAPDVRLHGERPGAESRDARLQADYFAAATEMIVETARDLSRLREHFAPPHAGLHGVSLGGYITFAALLLDPEWAAGAVALGSPDWLAPLRAFGLGPGHPAYDQAALLNPLALAPTAFPPRPLLMLHGAQDVAVPPDGVIQLEERLRPAYAAFPERLRLRVFPGLGHQYTDEMLSLSADWMERYLREGG